MLSTTIPRKALSRKKANGLAAGQPVRDVGGRQQAPEASDKCTKNVRKEGQSLVSFICLRIASTHFCTCSDCKETSLLSKPHSGSQVEEQAAALLSEVPKKASSNCNAKAMSREVPKAEAWSTPEQQCQSKIRQPGVRFCMRPARTPSPVEQSSALVAKAGTL